MDSRKFLDKFMDFKGGLPAEEPYPHFYITEGLIFFRDVANGGWLIDAIYKNLPRTEPNERDIVICELKVVDRVGTLVMTHFYSQRHTWVLEMKFRGIDLLIDEVPLYCQPVEDDWVLMTPHESLTMVVHKWTDDEPKPPSKRKRATKRATP